MCGIVGFTWPDKDKIIEIKQLLLHRGPDDTGIFYNNNVSLAQNRLTIIDLSLAGHQPMFYNANKGACSNKYLEKNIDECNLCIVFNGEIYNFIEIRNILKAKGYSFSTNCDTEIVLAAYSEWGERCVEQFNGMWAFCIYDIRKNHLFLSRDRFGIKPLYYTLNEKGLAFASELKPIYKLVENKKVNQYSLNHFHLFNYTPPNATIIEDIYKLEAGSNLLFDLSKRIISKKYKYWKARFIPNEITINEAKENVFNLLDNAVKSRLVSDVEVGAFLSGGVDSSVIVFFMQKYLPEFKTFSIKFDKHEYDESRWARIISRKFNTDHYEINFNAKDVAELIDKLPYYYDEPYGDSSMIPTYLVSKVASEHVKVVLSGTGGDEVFGGYNRYREYELLIKLRTLPLFVKKLICAAYQKINRDKANKLKELLNSESNNVLYIKLLSDLFRGNDSIQVKMDDFSSIFELFGKHKSINDVLCFDQNHYLTDDLLIKEDRATMAHSLEGRIPFLDYKLVNYVNNLPVKYKINGNISKYILKETFRSKLPNEILFRKKAGFGVPLAEYFRKELKKHIEEIIFDPSGMQYYDKSKIQKMWQLHQERKSDYHASLWNIVMLNKWNNIWSL